MRSASLKASCFDSRHSLYQVLPWHKYGSSVACKGQQGLWTFKNNNSC